MKKKYDSTLDTIIHIQKVQSLLREACNELWHRAIIHDFTKLLHPEKEGFDIATPKLQGLTFGTPEYQQSLDELKPTLDHHYAHNSHHPQYYQNGIDDMDLFDILEMLVDWKAASHRTIGGNILKSVKINKDRFNIGDQLYKVLMNTAERYYNNETEDEMEQMLIKIKQRKNE